MNNNSIIKIDHYIVNLEKQTVILEDGKILDVKTLSNLSNIYHCICIYEYIMDNYTLTVSEGWQKANEIYDYLKEEDISEADAIQFIMERSNT